jgi:GTP-binding protein
MKPEWNIVEAEFIAGVAAPEQMTPPALAEVAFAGRSNVGKSSLLNKLIGRRNLVRAGATPGTTRQLNLFQIRATDGLEMVLVDLPGYGFAKRAKHEKHRWGPLIEGYLLSRVTLRAVVLLVDVRRGPEAEELDLIEFIRSTEGKKSNRPPLGIILVATKVDKLPGSQRKPAVLAIGRKLGVKVLGFSAETGEGRDELWGAIRQRVAPKASLEQPPE